jgi:hypothetical protein
VGWFCERLLSVSWGRRVGDTDLRITDLTFVCLKIEAGLLRMMLLLEFAATNAAIVGARGCSNIKVALLIKVEHL